MKSLKIHSSHQIDSLAPRNRLQFSPRKFEIDTKQGPSLNRNALNKKNNSCITIRYIVVLGCTLSHSQATIRSCSKATWVRWLEKHISQMVVVQWWCTMMESVKSITLYYGSGWKWSELVRKLVDSTYWNRTDLEPTYIRVKLIHLIHLLSTSRTSLRRDYFVSQYFRIPINQSVFSHGIHGAGGEVSSIDPMGSSSVEIQGLGPRNPRFRPTGVIGVLGGERFKEEMMKIFFPLPLNIFDEICIQT